VWLGVSARGKTISESGKKALIGPREPLEVREEAGSAVWVEAKCVNAFMPYSLVAFLP